MACIPYESLSAAALGWRRQVRLAAALHYATLPTSSSADNRSHQSGRQSVALGLVVLHPVRCTDLSRDLVNVRRHPGLADGWRALLYGRVRLNATHPEFRQSVASVRWTEPRPGEVSIDAGRSSEVGCRHERRPPVTHSKPHWEEVINGMATPETTLNDAADPGVVTRLRRIVVVTNA